MVLIVYPPPHMLNCIAHALLKGATDYLGKLKYNKVFIFSKKSFLQETVFIYRNKIISIRQRDSLECSKQSLLNVISSKPRKQGTDPR